jgi:hypothetical protein
MSLIDPVAIPEGQRGPWTIRKIYVSEEDARGTAMRAALKGRGYAPPGSYTQLHHERRGIVMSDTPDEKRDHLSAVLNAKGHVLINGLGIGMVLSAVLKRPAVDRVTVIEIDPDVAALVGPAYTDARVQVIVANAFNYRLPKGIRYGAVWHDIWDHICGDNLAEMTRLKRKYGRTADWQGCWCEWECRRRS